MDILYTKKDFLDIFSTMGIDEGMVVLVQADLTGFNEILSGSQAIIEALQELVKEDGCIICPTFSLSCLDPACYEQNDYTYESWHQWLEKADHYTTIWAKERYESGKRTSLSSAFLHSFLGGLRALLIKKAFLDGWMGILSCGQHAFYTMLKYVKLYEMQINHKEG